MEKQVDIDQIINSLSFEEKVRLLTGGGALTTAENSEYDIPKLNLSDGPHGIRRLLKHPNPAYEQVCNIEGGDVCFPTSSALGSTWNKELVLEVGKAIARDCKEEDINMLLAPGVNMKRTPLCGRNFEYFSEDPVLSGELGAAFIQGVEEEGIATSLKHFAANNQETERSSISVEVDERTLREYYLRPFEIAVKKGNPASVMCAYNKLGGIWCSEHKWLIQDILRGEWVYEGIVVSDWHGVHSPSKAVKAGLDLQMPKNDRIADQVKEGIKKGIITQEHIDSILRRLIPFIQKVKNNEKKQEGYSRNRQHEIAQKAALETITLLKNDNSVLPVTSEKYKKVAVFGTFAEKPVIMGGGSSKVTVAEESIERPIDYIRMYADNDMEILYEPLFDQVTAGLNMYRKIEQITKEIDLAIVFLASEPDCETEGIDRKRLHFSEYMNDCVDEISKQCKNTVVIMQTGTCTAPSDWKDRVDGIIQMWFAGEGGGSALAKILFGIENPSGKLSETFITRLRKDLDFPGDKTKVWYQEGMFCGYRYYDNYPEDVWFPFGHGLSYTQFEYSDLIIEPKASGDEKQVVNVSLSVKNTGAVKGAEIIQLYVGKKESMVVRPEKALQDFCKVSLLPGEKKQIHFKLDRMAFAYYNVFLKDWHVESGEYEIMAGASSQDIRLRGGYEVYWDEDYTSVLKNKAIIL